MNPIFNTGPSLLHRLVLAIMMSLALMLMDHRLDSFGAARVYLNSLVSPIQYMANLPSQTLDWAAQEFATQRRLLSENEQLRKANMLMREDLQRFDVLQNENARLRTLLGSPVRQDARKMVAELMAVDNNPYGHQIIIDKGTIHGVYEGQPVLDANGIVGQVLQVATTNSRVLLIADITHAVPARVARNDVRVIVSGTGELGILQIQHMPHNVDLQQGDRLISSGLGEVFPEGYPVAEVTAVVRDEGRPFAQIQARPVAQLDRLKYLLLLWPADAPQQPVLSEEQP